MRTVSTMKLYLSSLLSTVRIPIDLEVKNTLHYEQKLELLKAYKTVKKIKILRIYFRVIFLTYLPTNYRILVLYLKGLGSAILMRVRRTSLITFFS